MINYTKNDWVQGKVFDPDTMNGIEQGIKSACDGVDALEGVPEALEREILDLKYLGYTVPRELGIQNQKTSSGYVVNVGREDLGGLSWTYYSAYGFFYSSGVSGVIAKATSNNTKADIYSPAYPTESYNTITGGTISKGISCDTTGVIGVRNTSYTDANTFKTAMRGHYLYYKLAKPYTIPLDGAEVYNDTNDLKFLGWTVPREYPGPRGYQDANGVYHKRVNRVDLGGLNWVYMSDEKRFYAYWSDYKRPSSNAEKGNIYTSKYTTTPYSQYASTDKSVAVAQSSGLIGIKDTSYTDATAFRNAMSGIYLHYEPVTEVVIAEGNEANSITETTTSYTTTSAGLINTNLPSSYEIVAMYSAGASYIITPWINGQTNTWYARVEIPSATYSVAANASISLVVKYRKH